MIDETQTLSSFRVEIQPFSGRTIAALTARLATRFFCFASDPDHARRIIRRLCLFAGADGPNLGIFPEAASPKYCELFVRGNDVIDQCSLVLGAFNKHANWHDTDEARAELAQRLLEAIALAFDFGPHEGIDLIHHAIGDDMSAAAHIECEADKGHRPGLDPFENGPFGVLWSGGTPVWWHSSNRPTSLR